ncbi:MAG: hypothetical protein R2909_20720 [Gemmatimonadales bacterium]
MNSIMADGNKSPAEAVFYRAMDLIEERTSQPGVTASRHPRQRQAVGRGEEPPGCGAAPAPGAGRGAPIGGPRSRCAG